MKRFPKMTRTSRCLMACVTVAAVLTASQAFAGYNSGTAYVQIYDDGSYREAAGSIRDVHDSPDTLQYIGCSVTAYGGSATPTVSCYARDAAGTSRWCVSGTASHVAAALSIDADTAVDFMWDGNARCTKVMVTHASWQSL